jgi:predicted dithiol-disulfide oxidoreductase (DUF899 family)
MMTHTTGTREEHLQARLELLTAEKELTQRGDELARQRRALPWVRVEKDYVFDTDDGKKSLAELFAGRSQLLVYHFMFGPEWLEGCPVCSFWADNFNGAVVHLNHRDVTMVCASRAPLDRLQAYKRRMGWSFPWVSSLNNEFNYDFRVSLPDVSAGPSQPEMTRDLPPRTDGFRYNFTKEPFIPEMPGLSAFALENGTVFNTYSTYGRGLDIFNGAYQLLDRTPLGRQEEDLPVPIAWLRRHDEYEPTAIRAGG